MVRGSVPEVQSCLANRDRSLPVTAQEGAELVDVVCRGVGTILRVNAERSENAGFLLCEAPGKFRCCNVDSR
jgi:hypothetical protein